MGESWLLVFGTRALQGFVWAGPQSQGNRSTASTIEKLRLWPFFRAGSATMPQAPSRRLFCARRPPRFSHDPSIRPYTHSKTDLRVAGSNPVVRHGGRSSAVEHQGNGFVVCSLGRAGFPLSLSPPAPVSRLRGPAAVDRFHGEPGTRTLPLARGDPHEEAKATQEGQPARETRACPRSRARPRRRTQRLPHVVRRAGLARGLLIPRCRKRHRRRRRPG